MRREVWSKVLGIVWAEVIELLLGVAWMEVVKRGMLRFRM